MNLCPFIYVSFQELAARGAVFLCNIGAGKPTTAARDHHKKWQPRPIRAHGGHKAGGL